jgi:hypothetical protein
VTNVASLSLITEVKSPITLLLSPAEIADRRAKGLCFHCNDKFTNGQRKECKQLFIIEVICEEDEWPADNEQMMPTISLHTLMGIQPRSGRTMQALITVNDTHLTTLLDSGSTHNFIDT